MKSYLFCLALLMFPIGLLGQNEQNTQSSSSLPKHSDQSLLTPSKMISLAAPLVPLSPRFPMDLTLANQQMQELEAAQQPQHNQKIFAEHQFPWWLLSLALMGLIGWWIWHRWRQQVMRTDFIASIPSPRERGLLSLQQLQTTKWLQQGQYNHYYMYLTNIARQFIQETWQLPSLSQTKEQLFDSIHQKQYEFSDDQRRIIFKLFMQADRIKFAGYQPSLAECQQAYELVQELLSKSKISS